MGKPLRVLIIDDNEKDALLVLAELARCGWDVAWERVDTREAMAEALDRSYFDLIVSDHPMPRFRAPDALSVWKERGLDSPFIVVSGAIGEEQAVELLKAGARDFFPKDRLSRLCSAVERELRAAEERRALRRSEREREEALQGLGRSERLFQDLFDSAPDAMVIVDAESVIRMASPQAGKLFGYEPEELTGKAAEVLVPSSARPEYRRFREQFVESPVPRLMGAGQQNLLALRKDGSTFPIEVGLSPMTTEPGAVIATIRDVTDRRRLEQHLRQVQKLQWVGRMAGGFAHDFNNILGVIFGQSQIMLRGMPPDHPLRARLERVLSASERAAGLTHQLLAFSRRQSCETRVLDLNESVEGLRNMLSRLLGEDVDVTFHPGEALGRIRGDPTQIEQILINLAVNARDAMPNGGRLAIATSNAETDKDYSRVHAGAAPGRHICLAVSDTGHGMNRDVQARIFEPFFTTKAPGQGAGLGLATVHDIVNQSQGFVHLYSEPGQGTTLKIYLPRVDAAPAKPPEPPSATGGTETVLLVEDETSFRALICELLEANGYTVLAVEDPTKAIETAERHEGVIHLLLTDVLMPSMNGWELALRVKERRPDIRVLYMSGYTEDAIAHEGVLEEGALLISKPFTQESLARKLREALGARPRDPSSPHRRTSA